MKQTWRHIFLWLAGWSHEQPRAFREYVVSSEEFMTEVRRQLLRQIRARLGRERPTWRIETTL